MIDTERPTQGLPEKLLWKSASLNGFFLPHHAKHFRRHLGRLCALYASGQLEARVLFQKRPTAPFEIFQFSFLSVVNVFSNKV